MASYIAAPVDWTETIPPQSEKDQERNVGHSAGLLSPFVELNPAVPLLRGSVFELLPLLACIMFSSTVSIEE